MTARHLTLISAFTGCVLTIIACGTSTDSTATGTATQAPAAAQSTPTNNDPRFLADDLPLLPAGVAMAVAPLEVMRATYEFAARHPEVMHYIPCFCGCERGGHTSNHDCFVAGRSPEGKVTTWDTHGIGCEICVDVAHTAWQM